MSMMTRVQSLLHRPSRSALADVLDWDLPGVRTLGQQGALVALAVLVVLISMSSVVTLHNKNLLSTFFAAVHRMIASMFHWTATCGKHWYNFPASVPHATVSDPTIYG